jgi:hypothetical protein
MREFSLSGLSYVTTLRDLTINCEYNWLTDNGASLVCLKKLKKLKLQFRNANLELEEFVALDQMTSLTNLSLEGNFNINLSTKLLKEYTHLSRLVLNALNNYT